MKAVLILLLVIILSFELTAQTNFQLPSIKENSLKNKDTINTSTFNMAVGYLSETHHKEISPLIGLNFNIHLYQRIFLNIGTEASVLFYKMQPYNYNIYFVPNYAFHEEKNKLSLYFGAGVCFLRPPIYMYLGWIFFGRMQYNFSRNFSTGLEIKLVKPESSEIEDRSYLSGLFYLSIRL